MTGKNKPVSSRRLRFAVIAIDVVLFTVMDNALKVLLMHVHRPPFFIHRLGVPGGLIDPKETADEAAYRHLAEKGGFNDVALEQLGTFSAIDRDPRGRVVSVAYMGLVPQGKSMLPDDRDVCFQSVDNLPPLAYDHNRIVASAVEHLRTKIAYTTVVASVLPRIFSFGDLQHIYEIILGHPLDKRNLRKKIMTLGMLKKVGKKRSGAAHRPAELYTFVKQKNSADKRVF